jgi:hypothetical protein
VLETRAGVGAEQEDSHVEGEQADHEQDQFH